MTTPTTTPTTTQTNSTTRSTTGPVPAEALTWQELLPPDRRFVALPSRRDPLVVAADDPPVLRYLRTALLTAPPHSALPDWAFAAARELLRLPLTWRLAPHLAPDHAAYEATPSSGSAQPAQGGGSAPHTPTRAVDTPEQAGAPGRGLAELIAAHGGRVLVLRHSHDPDASTLLLLFAAADAMPSLAVKLPARPGAAARVLAEADRLDILASLPLGALRRTVPEVVQLLGHPGLPALVTTAQPGMPMLVGYHRRGHTAHPETVRADLTAAQCWLAAFQSATAGDEAPLDLAPGVVETLSAESGGHPRMEKLAALRRRLRRLHARQVAVHGDFWPGNILLRHEMVSGVVDWERFEPAGSPTRDPARLVLSYSQYLDGHTRAGHRVRGHPGLVAGDPAAAVAYALDGSGWYPDLVRGSLARALARVGLPRSCGRDAVLAEVAALAAEATDKTFQRELLHVFDRLGDVRSTAEVTS